jgi:hypothetical protein
MNTSAQFCENISSNLNRVLGPEIGPSEFFKIGVARGTLMEFATDEHPSGKGQLAPTEYPNIESAPVIFDKSSVKKNIRAARIEWHIY